MIIIKKGDKVIGQIEDYGYSVRVNGEPLYSVIAVKGGTETVVWTEDLIGPETPETPVKYVYVEFEGRYIEEQDVYYIGVPNPVSFVPPMLKVYGEVTLKGIPSEGFTDTIPTIKVGGLLSQADKVIHIGFYQGGVLREEFSMTKHTSSLSKSTDSSKYNPDQDIYISIWYENY